MSKIFKILTKFSIYGLVFLVPLFFLPITVEPFEFNKIYLIFFLTAVGLISWLAEMIFYQRKIVFKKTVLDIFVVLYLLVMVLSAILSLDKNASLFGFYGRFWPSLVGVLSLGGFYFLAVNNIKIKKETDELNDQKLIPAERLVTIFSLSTLVATAISFCSLLGLWEAISKVLAFIPQVMKIRAFSTTGGFFVEGYLLDSLEMLCLLLAFVVPMVVVKLAFKRDVEMSKYRVASGDKGNVEMSSLEFRENAKKEMLNLEMARGTKKYRVARGLGYLLNLALLILGLAMLTIVNFWPAWVVLMVALLVFLVVALKSRLFKERINNLILALTLLCVAVFFVLPALLGFNNPLTKLMNQNNILAGLQNKIILQALPVETSWQTGLEGVKANPILGAGLGNLPYVFSKYKPASFWSGPYWQFRFDRLSSAMAEYLATVGLVGFLAYLALLVALIVMGGLLLRRYIEGRNVEISSLEFREGEGGVKMVMLLWVGVIALVVSQIVYYQNTTLAFGFWLMIALLGVYLNTNGKQKVFEFKDFPEIGLVFSVIFVAILMGLIFVSVPLVQHYRADVNYRGYLVSQGTNLVKLESAAKMADDQAIYHTVLALAYLKKFNEEIAKAQPDPEIVRKTLLSTREEINKSMATASNRVATQELAGIVYRDIREAALTLAAVSVANLEKSLQANPDDQKIMGDLEQVKKMAQEFDEMPIIAFEKAVKLEPKNPVLLTELGKLKNNKNDLVGARVLFEKAIALRGDYVLPYLQLSLVNEVEGKTKEAKDLLAQAVKLAPSWVDARFHLGRMYYNDKNYDNAIAQFQQALRYFPDHSNSLYSLAKVYEKRGENSKALELLRRVLELNPGNEAVLKEINALSIDSSGETKKK
ncbi:MAG: tetratricopeptide repeat protein [Candidatus Gribaldobacteria bacterium]|nr:tetratricopeptide repeat protein [Candidatus Gribaldobacteria bacterium]